MFDRLPNFRNFLGVQNNSGFPAGPGASARAESATIAPISSPASSSDGAAGDLSAAVAGPAFMPFISGDPLARLPGPARDIFRNLESDVDAASAISAALFDRQQELLLEKQKAEQRVRQLENRHGPRLPDDDPSLIDARLKAERAADEYNRVQAEYDRRSEAAKPTRALLANVRGYVERDLIHATSIESAPPVTASALRKGETYSVAVTEARARLEKLRDELAAVENATLPADIAKQKAAEQIRAIAERGKPNVLELIEGRRSLSFAARYVGAPFVTGPNGELLGKAGGDGYQVDTMATLCWLFERELADAVCREIDANADPACALTDEQIAKKIAQFSSAILQVEREEESLIRSAAEHGQPIARRPDADPRAVLGLSDTCPPPRRRFV